MRELRGTAVWRKVRAMTAVRSDPARFAGFLPLLAALALYFAITIGGVAQILAVAGEPIYGIDDVHIHMAIARNLAQHGVYGVTPFEATHASSSPLWVLLLAAGFAVIGPWYWWPGLLAALSSVAVIAVAGKYLRGQSAGNESFGDLAGRGFVLCVVVAGASLPALTLQGMEHPLHAALMLLAAWLGTLAIAERELDRGRDMALMVLCLALPILRYESLWLTALLAAGLLWRRRYGLAAMIVVASTASVCALGFWATSKGLTFLPAPVLTKSVGPMLLSDNSLLRLGAKFVWHPLWRLSGVPMLALLFATGVVYLAVMLWRRRRAVLDDVSILMVALFVGGAWIHATFATFGWGSRYEAYMIVLGTVSLGAIALQLPYRLQAPLKWHRLAGLLAGLAAALTIYTALGRAQVTYKNVQAASGEVLNRDFYVARFLATAYPRESVLAMNIGAVVWEGEPRLLDPVALGTPDILPLIFARRFNVEALDTMARERKVRVFAVFDDWFEEWVGGKPPWTRVALIDASNDRRRLVLTLYVSNDAEGKRLAEALRTTRPTGKFTATVKILSPFDQP